MKMVTACFGLRGLFAVLTCSSILASASSAAAEHHEHGVHGSAHTELPRLSLGVFLNTGFVRGNGFALFSDSPDLVGGGLAGELRLATLGRVGLSARAEISGEESTGKWAQGSTKYEGSSVAVGGVVDVSVLRHLRPYAQITGGLSSAKVRLNSNSDLGFAADDQVMFATGAAGVRLVSRAKAWWLGAPEFAFSAFLEGGYTVAGDFEFSLRARGSVLREDIAFESVNLGSLARSRAHVRFGGTIHF